MNEIRPFQFHQFTVRQNRAAMKVGTDAILLGAWAGQGMAGVESVLDAGTGTGVIALMVAQRFPRASVTGVDIDQAAIVEASENVRNSPWSDRCRMECRAIQDVRDGRFDLIVSNPPWFRAGLLPEEIRRATARHDATMTLENLVSAAVSLLAPSGRLAVVVPADVRERIEGIAADSNLRCCRRTFVSPTPQNSPKRLLLEFGRDKERTCDESRIAVERRRHEYTPEYAHLTKDFLLRAPQFL